jgi:hypothetical protein
MNENLFRNGVQHELHADKGDHNDLEIHSYTASIHGDHRYEPF